MRKSMLHYRDCMHSCFHLFAIFCYLFCLLCLGIWLHDKTFLFYSSILCNLQSEVAVDMKQRYIGHCNMGTDIKQASFLGQLGVIDMDLIFWIWCPNINLLSQKFFLLFWTLSMKTSCYPWLDSSGHCWMEMHVRVGFATILLFIIIQISQKSTPDGNKLTKRRVYYF